MNKFQGGQQTSPVSSKKKKFKPHSPAKKRFGFGKRQFQGVKSVPQNYGSA